MKNLFLTIAFTLFCILILGLSIRGLPGNPTEEVLNNPEWKDEGPLELSPERGRFALLYSLVEDNSFHFSLPVARFATPDLGYTNGKYVSLFAPGISFFAIPGYLIGKYFGLAQVGTFAIITLYALANTLLIKTICDRLGVHKLASILAAITFIFATPAFAYSVSFFQHHISTFLILASFYILLTTRGVLALALIWFLMAISIPVDYPNLILMLPIALFALGRLVLIDKRSESIILKLKIAGVFTLITALLPILFLFWFNKESYGNPYQLAGTVSSVKVIDENGLPTFPKDTGTEQKEIFSDPRKQKKSALAFFKTRNLLRGLTIHFLSRDRGILLFTPVVFLAIFGAVSLSRRNPKILALIVSILGLNILLYSMWGDAWGGWAFGSRYLIPSYALACLLLGFTLTQARKSVFLILFLALLSYSISVNTLGAITSSRNPPQVEILNLEKLSGRVEKFSYDRNLEYLDSNQSKSFIFNAFLKDKISAWSYYQIITLTLIGASSLTLIALNIQTKEQKL